MNTVRISLALLFALWASGLPTVEASNLVPAETPPAPKLSTPAEPPNPSPSAPKAKPSAVNHSKTTAKAIKVDLSGIWYFNSTWRDWHSGRITLKQTGNKITGTWHTDVGKKEDDLPLFGEIIGDTVYLTRYMIWGKFENQNHFTLAVAKGGNQLFGYGEGFFLNHADLNMARMASLSPKNSKTGEGGAPLQQSKIDTPDVSGTWFFNSSWRDWHSGRITLKQSGTKLTGMWHTMDGKKEEDLPLFGEVVGNTVYLTRYNIWGKYENQNKFTLTLLNGGNQLFGYGEGFFLDHADLNMSRADHPQIVVVPPSAPASDKSAETEVNVNTASASVVAQKMPRTQSLEAAGATGQTIASAGADGLPPQARATAASASSLAQPSSAAAEATSASEKKESSADQKQKADARANELFNQLQSLVKEFYPKAQCSSSDGTLHFEFKTKDEVGYYSNRPVKAPQAGGILGDITLESGRYDGKLLSEQADGFHSILTLAPYSASTNAHILAKVLFPSDVPAEFKERLVELVNAFGKD